MTCGADCQGCAPCVERMGDGGFTLPHLIVSLTDIDNLKSRLDPDMRATDATAARCHIDQDTAEAWHNFYAAWRTYADTPTVQQVFCPDLVTRAAGVGCIGAGAVYEDGLEREKRMYGWQQKLKTLCGDGVAPWVDDPSKRAPDTSWVKWVAAAVAVVGIAYTAGPAARGIAKGFFK